MEIVIKINEDAYNLLEQKYRNGKADALDCIILNGNILPKGHGRLIDADELLENASQVYDERRHIWTQDFVVNADDVDSAPTILEADKGE